MKMIWMSPRLPRLYQSSSGLRHLIPLAYVIRIDPQVPGTAPTLAPNQPHSTERGSVESELIAGASHTHALFRDDNSVVYYHLEEATRGTSYAASIKPFQKVKDGRGAWKALTSQYAGKDKWEAEIKCQEQLLHTRIWKGQSNFSLENFISMHFSEMTSLWCIITWRKPPGEPPMQHQSSLSRKYKMEGEHGKP